MAEGMSVGTGDMQAGMPALLVPFLPERATNKRGQLVGFPSLVVRRSFGHPGTILGPSWHLPGTSRADDMEEVGFMLEGSPGAARLAIR
jgi:hypothetical protein